MLYRKPAGSTQGAGFEVLTDKKYLTSDAYLLEGDILLNDGAHVATNLTNGAKASGGGASQTVPINSNVKLETAKGFNKSLAGTVQGNGSRSVESTVGSRNRKRQESLDDNAERRDVSVLWILHGCVRSEVVVCSI